METPKEYYYTYYSYEEWGRGYIGSRGCNCLPEEDVKYLGSSADKTFKPTQKIILKSDYATREEAYADEIILQRYYKVVENPHFANRAYQTSIGFSTYGLFPSKETKRKMSEWQKGEKNPNYGKKWWSDGNGNCQMSVECPGKDWVIGNEKIKKDKHPQYGKPRTEETKRKQSIKSRGKNNHFYGKTHSTKTRRNQSEVKRGENNPNYGKRWWNDGNGNTKLSKECPGENWCLGGIKRRDT